MCDCELYSSDFLTERHRNGAPGSSLKFIRRLPRRRHLRLVLPLVFRMALTARFKNVHEDSAEPESMHTNEDSAEPEPMHANKDSAEPEPMHTNGDSAEPEPMHTNEDSAELESRFGSIWTTFIGNFLQNVIGMARRWEARFNQTASSASPSPTCSSSSLPNQGNRCFTDDHKNLSKDSAEPKRTSPAGDSAKTLHNPSHNFRRRLCEDSAEPEPQPSPKTLQRLGGESGSLGL